LALGTSFRTAVAKMLTKTSGYAEGVLIQSTGSVDDNTLVRFYSSNNCAPGTEIAEGNSNCIGVDNELDGAYGSFKVVASTTPIASTTRKGRRSSSKRPLIYHGSLAAFDGITYRWQQITSNGWAGILPEQWDDSINVMNNTVLPSLNDTTTLEDRDLDSRGPFPTLSGLCGISLDCLQALASGAELNDVFPQWFATAVNAAAFYGTSFYHLLNQPFVSSKLNTHNGGQDPSRVHLRASRHVYSQFVDRG
jgi:hypothetical protein